MELRFPFVAFGLWAAGGVGVLRPQRFLNDGQDLLPQKRRFRVRALGLEGIRFLDQLLKLCHCGVRSRPPLGQWIRSRRARA